MMFFRCCRAFNFDWDVVEWDDTKSLIGSEHDDSSVEEIIVLPNEERRNVSKLNIYEDIQECKKILEVSRRNLKCYKTLIEKNESIKNLWSATNCLLMIGMPLLVLAGASAVHASVSQTVRAASAVFEQPLNVAYERLSSFTQNYTATISNWTSRAAFARKVFEGCLTPPDMFGGLMRNHTTRYNYIYYNSYISNQFSGIVYTSIRLLEDHEGSWNSTQESKVHGCDSIFQLCDAYAKWDLAWFNSG